MGDTSEIRQNTPAQNSSSTSAIQPAITQMPRPRAARRRGQCPKPRQDARAVGAQRRGIRAS
jgi:hypothetical protein